MLHQGIAAEGRSQVASDAPVLGTTLGMVMVRSDPDVAENSGAQTVVTELPDV